MTLASWRGPSAFNGEVRSALSAASPHKRSDMKTTWMVRGDGGRLYDAFRDKSFVALGWAELAAEVKLGMTKKEIAALYLKKNPKHKPGRAIASAGQIWRFANEMAVGDRVVTYSPSNRTYLLGTVTGPFEYTPETAEQGLALVRPVAWLPTEIGRDQLSDRAKNTLGSTLTVFMVPEVTAAEISKAEANKDGDVYPAGAQVEVGIEEEEEEEEAFKAGLPTTRDPLEGVEFAAVERIKDAVIDLDWEDMQELVAGILRAMGYKTQVSPPGPDRGKDIIASPDGFGFEHPRIVVEVKHRSGQMDSKAIRSFLGGRHKDDRGLYVSTGGFTKDAYYEADRAAVPLTLWTIDSLVRTLVDHYDSTDAETKRLVPLKRMYLLA